MSHMPDRFTRLGGLDLGMQHRLLPIGLHLGLDSSFS